MRGLRAHYHLLEPGAAACFCPAALLQSSGDMGCARSCGWPRLVASCSLAQARTLELQCNGGTAWQGARARHGMAACVGSGAGGSAKHPPLGFQPDQDEDLPTDCTEPDSEGQPGWEGAPVTSTAPEEPCRLVLSTPSSILQEREIEELGLHLPTRLRQQPWSLLYCTARDGFSLRTLYRCTSQLSSPALLLIRDTEAQAFGAFSTSPIHVSSGFYGTGETFLFSFSPELKVFRWTGRNNFFLKGDVDMLMVGAGSGKFGLWLDGDLHHGGSCPCETFNNESLSPRGEFCVRDLEVWGLA
ncbi:TLD domain-containing protein 2 isoform X1 [Gallus gallus]|uniref:TLD domain-containing protein 2 isoform X1 n=1 Tax=Gallus gallus TaxID=9031 RepID=UPI001AE1E845|nr:TLD domain-containing protein 2 isoform X1 [Gallus gallus]